MPPICAIAECPNGTIWAGRSVWDNPSAHPGRSRTARRARSGLCSARTAGVRSRWWCATAIAWRRQRARRPQSAHARRASRRRYRSTPLPLTAPPPVGSRRTSTMRPRPCTGLALPCPQRGIPAAQLRSPSARSASRHTVAFEQMRPLRRLRCYMRTRRRESAERAIQLPRHRQPKWCEWVALSAWRTTDASPPRAAHVRSRALVARQLGD
jgi:hypothetical protein